MTLDGGRGGAGRRRRTVDRLPLVKAPGDSVAYFAFHVPATTTTSPKFTVTLYDAHGHKVGTVSNAGQAGSAG